MKRWRPPGAVPPAAEPVLIVALSARALARSAAAAGFAPIALDAFGDLDLRAVVRAWRRIPWGADGQLRRDVLLMAARELAPPPIPLVVGSGFERAITTLEALAHGRPFWGTPPARVRRLKDPFAFARLCRQLGLPHPEVRRTPPADPTGWLAKRRGGAGGGHVRPARRARGSTGLYFQRRAAGRPASVLVAGTGHAARALGFAWQRTQPGSFRFRGVLVPPRPPSGSARLFAMAERLAAAGGLCGLGSVDVLLDPPRLTVLELNPRPTAALEVYEEAMGAPGLFAAHVAASEGRLPSPLCLRRAAVSEIVPAPRALVLPPDFPWPDACRDLTPPGVVVPAGAPLCTLVVAADDTAGALAALETARQALYRGIAAWARPACQRTTRSMEAERWKTGA